MSTSGKTAFHFTFSFRFDVEDTMLQAWLYPPKPEVAAEKGQNTRTKHYQGKIFRFIFHPCPRNGCIKFLTEARKPLWRTITPLLARKWEMWIGRLVECCRSPRCSRPCCATQHPAHLKSIQYSSLMFGERVTSLLPIRVK